MGGENNKKKGWVVKTTKTRMVGEDNQTKEGSEKKR